MPARKGKTHNTDANGAEQKHSLYETLGLEMTATQAEIKKAYHKLALQLHPDKNPGDEAAHSNFQALQRVFAVLSDPEKRKFYDETGSLEDSEQLSSEAFNNLYDYYRTMFPKVTEADIDKYHQEYRGSEEETADLLQLYNRFRGDMDQVLEWQICSEPKRDSHRFMDAIESAIAEDKVKRYKAYKPWAKDLATKPRPKDPLKPRKTRKAEADAEQDLALQIRQRNAASFYRLTAELEAKYGGGKKQRKR